LKDSPRAISGGFACGMGTHFYPTFGFGPLFAVGAARLSGTNMVAATAAWAITMPFFPLFFYLNIVTGTAVDNLNINRINLVTKRLSQIDISTVLHVGKAFLIGSVVNGLFGTAVMWLTGYILLKRHRKKVIGFICRVL
jgi:uncharacterized protein (DUF2062 family)